MFSNNQTAPGNRLEGKEMKRIPRVRNMVGHGDRAVANQFEIFTDDGVYFQSYSTIIAFRSNGKATLDRNYWDYSTTTGKYRNIFLGEKKSETEKKIADGTYKLADLNSNR
jgi:hypothetical protein